MRFNLRIFTATVMVGLATSAMLSTATRWQPVTFSEVRATEYTLERLPDGVALRAESTRAASGLVVEFDVDLEPAAISWRWRVERCLDNAAEHERAGDDFAARVFVLLGRDRSWTPWGWFRRQVFKSPFGRIRPKRALSYVWASCTAKGDSAFSPVSDDIYQVVARSGCQQDADWVAERHELSRDFARAFQEPMPEVVGLAVMTDTDDTEGQTTAWYRDVVLHLQTGSSLSVPFDGDFDEQAR